MSTIRVAVIAVVPTGTNTAASTTDDAGMFGMHGSAAGTPATADNAPDPSETIRSNRACDPAAPIATVPPVTVPGEPATLTTPAATATVMFGDPCAVTAHPDRTPDPADAAVITSKSTLSGSACCT